MSTSPALSRSSGEVRRAAAPLLAAPLLAALGLCAVAADCQQTSDVRVGNIDTPGDVVLVTGADGHTYGVLSNPELGFLRVVDLTQERFLDAPNRFFPLSVPVGLEVRRLAVAPDDDTRIYALDTASDAVVVVRGADDATAAFVPLEAPVATDRAPADLAAVRAADGSVNLWITLPARGEVQVLGVGQDGASIGERARIALPAGSRPGAIVAEPLGDAVVVADAALPLAHVLRSDTLELERSLDVGGPLSALAAGVVDAGDGFAPVVLAARSDAPVVVALRLFRPGYREPRYAVLGAAELPALPLVTWVPDQRGEAPTVCCRALSSAAVEAGEATAAWAAVGLANGDIHYLALDAWNAAGRGSVRLIDNDLEGLTLRDVQTPTWLPEPGDEERAPVAALAPRADVSDPPFAPLLPSDATLTLVWQGDLPALTDVGVSLTEGAVVAQVDLERRGARPGDIALLSASAQPDACAAVHVVPIVAVQGSALEVLRAPDGLDDEALACLAAGTDTRLTVAVGDGFVALDGDAALLGRLSLSGAGADAAAETLELPEAALVVAPAVAGPPRMRGSTLLVPLDPHVDAVVLPLAAPALRVGGDGGGVGQAGFLPVAITGAAMDIPGSASGTTTRARRMVVATASADGGGNILLACDDAETLVALCDQFR